MSVTVAPTASGSPRSRATRFSIRHSIPGSRGRAGYPTGWRVIHEAVVALLRAVRRRREVFTDRRCVARRGTPRPWYGGKACMIAPRRHHFLRIAPTDACTP